MRVRPSAIRGINQGQIVRQASPTVNTSTDHPSDPSKTDTIPPPTNRPTAFLPINPSTSLSRPQTPPTHQPYRTRTVFLASPVPLPTPNSRSRSLLVPIPILVSLTPLPNPPLRHQHPPPSPPSIPWLERSIGDLAICPPSRSMDPEGVGRALGMRDGWDLR